MTTTTSDVPELGPSGLPSSLPIFDVDTQEYWRAAGAGRLVVSTCTQCGRFVWIPRPICPHDLAETTWVEVSGAGTVYSYTVVHRGERAYAGRAPFVLAYVELAEGPRVMTNIVGCAPDQVAVGMPVRVVFDPVEPAGEGGGEPIAIPRFTPVPSPE